MRALVLIVTSGAVAWAAAHAPAKSGPAACPATIVRYLPAKHPTLGDVPWVLARPSTAGVIGFVTSYPPTLRDGRVNRSDGLVLWRHGGRIVWTVPGPPAAATLVAARLDGHGSFHIRVSRSGEGLESAPSFPSSGCWRLTLRSASTEASVVTRVVAPPRTLRCDTTPIVAPDWAVARPHSAAIRGAWAWRTPAGGALMYTHGVGPGAMNAKVAWWVRRNWGTTLELAGIRLDADGSFRQELPVVRGEHDRPQEQGVFTSTVDVPAAGCWLFRLRTARLAGVVVVRAVDVP